MASDPMTIHNLDDGALGNIFAHLDPEFRAKTVPRVCKAWQRVERDQPHKVKRIIMFPKREWRIDNRAYFLDWHLRDTSRLKNVHFIGSTSDQADMERFLDRRYWELAAKLLCHLKDHAPNLRVFGVWPLFPDVNFFSPQHPVLLPLICQLTQVQSLHLTNWQWAREDVPAMAQLTRLQNLKCLNLARVLCVDAYELLFMEEAAATLQASLCSLQLTSLELRNVDLAGLEGFQRLPPGNLTNLRSLTCYGGMFDLRMPYITQLTNLTGLRMSTPKNLDLLDKLLSLHQLESLQIHSEVYFQNLTILRDTKFTSLSIHGTVGIHERAWDVAQWSVPPFEMLHTVKHLSLKLKDVWISESDWLGTWSMLASLTHFNYEAPLGGNSKKYQLPWFATQMRFLRSLRGVVDFETFDHRGKRFLLSLLGDQCCPCLAEVRLKIVEVAAAERAFPEWRRRNIGAALSKGRWRFDAEKRLNDICTKLRQREGVNFKIDKLAESFQDLQWHDYSVTITR